MGTSPSWHPSEPAPFAIPGIVALLLIFSTPAAADTIHLRNGRVVNADQCREETGEILCRKAGGMIGFPSSMVERIERGASPAAADAMRPFRAAAPAPPPAGDESPLGQAAPLEVVVSAGTASVFGDGPAAWRKRIGELEEMLGRPGGADSGVRREMAVLYTLIANSDAEAGDFEAAGAGYLRATDNDPALSAARLNLARVRLQQGRNDEAESIVREVRSSLPDDARALALLGEIDYRKGNIDSAIESWSAAVRIAPDAALEEKLRKARKEGQVEEGFSRADAVHFSLKYDGASASSALSREILDHLESTYDALTAKFNAFPRSVIVVTLYAREEFHDVTESPAWVGGLFDGQIRVPIGGLSHLTRIARDVFTHELAHCIVFHKTRGNSPKWLQEGIAQWVEGKTARGQRRALASSFSGATAAEVSQEFSYPQALSTLEKFLATWSFSHLLDLLDALGRGRGFDAAFVSTTGQDFGSFLDQWLRDLHSPEGAL